MNGIRSPLHGLRVGFLSDVHVHRHDQGEAVAGLVRHIRSQEPPDLLVVAGDISHRLSEVRTFLTDVSLECARCWVPGNHDVWVIDAEHEGDTAEHRYRVAFPRLSEEVGWHYLPAAPMVIEEGAVGVVGTMGWFSGRGYSEWFDRRADEADDRLARGFAEDLDRAVAELPPGIPIIVVTHHVSHRSCPCYAPSEKGELNEYLQTVLERHRERIGLVIHGHKHQRHDPAVIDGIPFVAHPFGYPYQHDDVEDGYRVLDVSDVARP